MAEDAWRPSEPLAHEETRPTEAGGRPGLGVVLAAILAVLASAGLAWWFAAPQAPPQILNAPPEHVDAAPARPAAPLRYAPAEPDTDQVKQAWRETQAGYVDGGPDALVRGSMGCARALPEDPRRLDYCVAYDIYASEITAGDGGAADWFRDAGQRDLALARMALPEGADPANRIAQLGALTRAVIPKPVAQRPKPVRAERAARPARPAAKAATARRERARPAHQAGRPKHRVHRRKPRNFPAEIYPYTTLPDPPPPAAGLEPPH